MRRPRPPFPEGGGEAERVRSILVVKLSSLGDVLLAAAVLPHLRASFPAACIDWLAETEGEGLVRTSPSLRRVCVFPRRELAALFPWRPVRAWRLWRACMSDLRTERYDLVLDMQGRARSWLVSLLARLKPKGIRAGKGRFLGMHYKSPHRRAFLRHAVPSYFEVLSVLGFPPPPIQDMRVPYALSAEGEAEAREFLAGKSIQSPYVVFHVFTTWPSKHWPEGHWIELAKLCHACGLAVVLSGSRADSACAEALAHRMGLAVTTGGTRADSACAEALAQRLDHAVTADAGCPAPALAVNAAGSLGFAGFAWLARGAYAVVSVDSFPMHLAAAAGARVLSLHGPTDPLRTGPWGEACRALSALGEFRPREQGSAPDAALLADPATDADVRAAPTCSVGHEAPACGCVPCRKRRCLRWYSACMRLITPERVFAALAVADDPQ